MRNKTKNIVLTSVEILLNFGIISILSVALTGNYWYDIKGADLSDQGFGKDFKIFIIVNFMGPIPKCLFCFRKNLSIHGGLFRSCGPPLDPESGKVEDCPTFEEVLGGIIQRPLIIGRTLLISTIVIHFVVLLLSLGMVKYISVKY